MDYWKRVKCEISGLQFYITLDSTSNLFISCDFALAQAGCVGGVSTHPLWNRDLMFTLFYLRLKIQAVIGMFTRLSSRARDGLIKSLEECMYVENVQIMAIEFAR